MNVEYLERGRFLVESESTKDEFYLVDLLERGRRGTCDCRDFEIRVQAVIDRGEEPMNDNCKHIRHVTSLIPDCKRILFRMAAFEAECAKNPERFGRVK